MALGECGRLPIAYHYNVKFIKYWLRLIHMDQSRYPKNCYDMLKRYDNIGRTSWVSKVREFLFSYGFSIVWISQEVGNITQFVSIFKQRLKDCAFQVWHSESNDFPRCDFYKNFKSLLNVEKNLTIDILPYYKRSLSRLRRSNHKLNVEYGRYFNTNREDRICFYCFLHENDLIVEDEYHAFFICDKFKEIREIYLYSWFTGQPSRENLHSIFLSQNTLTIKRLALYVTKLMELI